MLPTPPNFSTGSSSLPPFSLPTTFAPVAPFTAPAQAQPTFLGDSLVHQTGDPLHQAADPNSPDSFKNSALLVHQQVLELQAFARRVLLAIQHAYQTGNSPAHTEADMSTLKQMLALVIEKMRLSGVGALPVLPPNMSVLPTEAQLYDSTNRNLQVLYEKLQNSQNSASVAANLLVTDHGQNRMGK